MSAIGRVNLLSILVPPHMPPLWEQAAELRDHWDETPAPVPEFAFDQRLGW